MYFYLYGLPKTHKKDLALRPILSATGTYNNALAKWLDKKLKAKSISKFTITDTVPFAQEIKELPVSTNDILVSYDVTALFTNVPLKETINILADRAFEKDWFNKTHNLNITKSVLIELLAAATENQLFHFNNKLFTQNDGVAMGTPLGTLMANTFLCFIEEQ